MNGLGNFEIHFTDNTGVKDLTKKCDVRMTIVKYCRQGKKIARVLDNGMDITKFAIHGLPI